MTIGGSGLILDTCTIERPDPDAEPSETPIVVDYFDAELTAAGYRVSVEGMPRATGDTATITVTYTGAADARLDAFKIGVIDPVSNQILAVGVNNFGERSTSARENGQQLRYTFDLSAFLEGAAKRNQDLNIDAVKEIVFYPGDDGVTIKDNKIDRIRVTTPYINETEDPGTDPDNPPISGPETFELPDTNIGTSVDEGYHIDITGFARDEGNTATFTLTYVGANATADRLVAFQFAYVDPFSGEVVPLRSTQQMVTNKNYGVTVQK